MKGKPRCAAAAELIACNLPLGHKGKHRSLSSLNKAVAVPVDSLIELLEAAAMTSGYVSAGRQKYLRHQVNKVVPKYEWQNEVDE